MPHTQIDDHDGIDVQGLNAALVAEQVRSITQNRLDLIANEVNACIVGAVLWKLYPEWVVLTWLGLFSIVVVVRFILRRRYQLVVPGPGTIRRWGWSFTVGAFVTGCLWSLTGSAVLITAEPLYNLFALFLLGGMLAGCIVRNSAYMPVVYAFVFPASLPVIIILLTRHNLIQIMMGLLFGVFAVVLLGTGYSINRSIAENFRLRISQGILLERVRKSEAVMAMAQEIAHVGSWDIDLVTQTYGCSAEAYRIFGVDIAKPRPSYQEMLERIHPDDREMVRKKIHAMIATGIG
jgi:hypothetical protein